MLPNFLPDDFVIAATWPFIQFKPGEVIVINHPVYHTIIKRVLYINAIGELLLQGDHRKSAPPHLLGWQPTNRVVGKVLWRIPNNHN